MSVRRLRSCCEPSKAFSLLELLAVVTILGLIAVLIVPRITQGKETAEQNACFTNKAEINSVVERYFVEKGSLPSSIADLDVAEYFPSGIPVCPVSGKPYALHPTTKRVLGHTGTGKGVGH